jgi:hypothetical protein
VQWKRRFTRTDDFTISPNSMHFPQISRSLLHEIVSDKLRFRELCSRWEPKMLTDGHNTSKRRGILGRGVVMLHDNARPHTVAATRHLTRNNSIIHPPPLQPRLRAK